MDNTENEEELIFGRVAEPIFHEAELQTGLAKSADAKMVRTQFFSISDRTG